jgi:hypothetical protein
MQFLVFAPSARIIRFPILCTPIARGQIRTIRPAEQIREPGSQLVDSGPCRSGDYDPDWDSKPNLASQQERRSTDYENQVFHSPCQPLLHLILDASVATPELTRSPLFPKTKIDARVGRLAEEDKGPAESFHKLPDLQLRQTRTKQHAAL